MEVEFYILVVPERLILRVHHLSVQTTEVPVQSNQSANSNTFDVVVSLRWRHSLNKIPQGDSISLLTKPK